MKMPRMATVGLLMAALMLAFTPPASAGTQEIKTRWRNCDKFTSAISVKAKFFRPVQYHGKGRYMVKRWVKWQYWKGGSWRTADRRYTESNWLKITNPRYNYVTTAADRTNWAGLYYSHWRVEVTVKLIKNRKGPRDKKVDEIQIFPKKGSFREIGSYCGYEF